MVWETSLSVSFPLPLCFSCFERGNCIRVVGEFGRGWCVESDIQ